MFALISTNATFQTENTPNLSPWDVYDNDTNETVPFCKKILLQEIGALSMRVWDLAIFVPNVLFLSFLLRIFCDMRAKLKSSPSPLFASFYILTYATCLLNILRCVVSMCLSALNLNGTIADKTLWLLLQFCMFSAELSILSFGLFFGHLDSRTSIRRVLCITISIGVVYSITQAVLEFSGTHIHYETNTTRIILFSHGGVIFWSCTSALMSLVYLTTCLLPFLPRMKSFILPTKRRFYVYCAFLSILNCLQVIGTTMISEGALSGICIVCLTSYVYFAFYTPIIYLAFLRGHSNTAQSTLLFSYKPQRDDFVAETPPATSATGRYFGIVPALSTDDASLSSSSFFDEFLNPSSPLDRPDYNPLYDDALEKYYSNPASRYYSNKTDLSKLSDYGKLNKSGHQGSKDRHWRSDPPTARFFDSTERTVPVGGVLELKSDENTAENLASKASSFQTHKRNEIV